MQHAQQLELEDTFLEVLKLDRQMKNYGVNSPRKEFGRDLFGLAGCTLCAGRDET